MSADAALLTLHGADFGYGRDPIVRDVSLAIVPGESHAEANPWADHVIVTGIGHARNLAVAASGDAVIAVGGSWGTLAEIGFAMRLGRPVVVLEGGPAVEGVPRAETPAQAVELALEGIAAS